MKQSDSLSDYPGEYKDGNQEPGYDNGVQNSIGKCVFLPLNSIITHFSQFINWFLIKT